MLTNVLVGLRVSVSVTGQQMEQFGARKLTESLNSIYLLPNTR
jgi:hypothetical protein